ncbi:MAG: hypothetical protein ACYDG0_06465 [Vulcanimicrobiaceae bacterium]
MFTRRQLIRTGIAGAVVLAVAGVGYQLYSDERAAPPDAHAYKVLDTEARVIVGAIAPAMLAGALPSAKEPRALAIRAVVRGFDTAVAGLSPSVQGEVHQLLSLLGFPLTRWTVAGVWAPWHEASVAEVDGFLTRWRYSSFAMLRSGYDALHQLVNAAWYGNAESWPAIGYAGPPVLRSSQRS